jgi:hypothetical protein
LFHNSTTHRYNWFCLSYFLIHFFINIDCWIT